MTDEATRVQRRLAAILAADVVGFSALMSRDEEGTHARIGALQRGVISPAVQRHQGRVVKTTGDGFLIEFASPVEAVRCALAVQKALADGPLHLRIGINLGDVIIEPDGDIYGEGVNVAARLEALCEPGGVLISGKVYDEAEGKIDASFESCGEHQVKNITKPVRVYALAGPYGEDTAFHPDPPSNNDKASIAVLPFTNISGDPEQEYFADGVVEDIITALSHFNRLLVIARNSSFTYKGRAVDVRQVGQELGVRYVLEGSVRKAGGRIRITGQLINTADGSHLWADRFEGLLEDIFELQDQVTSKVVGSIAPRLLEAEVERASRRRPDNLDVYDLYLRALPAVRAITLEGNNTALALVERALKLDPDYAVAAGLGAWAYTLRAAQNWRIDPEGERQRAIELARIALAKGQDDADALAMGGYTIGFLGHQLRDAVAATDRAITLNPNSALAHANAGWLHAYLGAADRAIDHLQCSIRLSPRDPTLFRVHAALAFAHLLRNEFDIAAEWGRRAFDANPNFAPTHRVLAAALAHAGRVDEARQVAEHLLAVSPQDSVSRFAGYSVFRYSGRLDLILDGLRMAGVPE